MPVRGPDVKSILIKNVLNTCIGTLMWWAIGHTFAQGDCSASTNALIGTTGFFSSNAPQNETGSYWALWLFGWSFCAVSTTIPSGALAERCQLRAYIIYTIVHSGITYPLVVHAMWSTVRTQSFLAVICCQMFKY